MPPATLGYEFWLEVLDSYCEAHGIERPAADLCEVLPWAILQGKVVAETQDRHQELEFDFLQFNRQRIYRDCQRGLAEIERAKATLELDDNQKARLDKCKRQLEAGLSGKLL